MHIVYLSLPLNISEIIYKDLQLKVINNNLSKNDEYKCSDTSQNSIPKI